MASTPAHSWQIPVIFSVSTPSHLWWLKECCLILLIFLFIRFKWHILWSNTFSWRQNGAKWLRTKREKYEVDIFWCDTENLNIFRCDKDQMNMIWRYKDNCRISCGASPLQSIRWFFAIFLFCHWVPLPYCIVHTIMTLISMLVVAMILMSSLESSNEYHSQYVAKERVTSISNIRQKQLWQKRFLAPSAASQILLKTQALMSRRIQQAWQL